MNIIRMFLHLIKNIITKYYNKIFWCFTKPDFPRTDGIYLHLGCGNIDYPDFINIDVYPFKHVHIVSDARDLKRFKNDSVDLIYISHCLEHFRFEEMHRVLNEYFRVLKTDGILRISVPDFDTIIAIFKKEKTIEAIQGVLMGAQDYKYNFHHSVFDEQYLDKLLVLAGFKKTQKWQYGTGRFKDLPDWSGRQLGSPSNTFYDISLNIEAIK